MRPILSSSTILLLAALGCSTSSPGGPQDKAAPPPANAPPVVSVVPVLSRKLHTTISLPAQLLPYESVDIYPKVTGFVQAVTVDRGSQVRRGQLLVRLAAPELSSQRAQAEASVRAAQSQLASAQAKLASDNGTYLHMVAASKTPGVLAENDVTVASQTVLGDKGVVAAAEQNIAAARDVLRSVGQTESGQAGAQPILQIVNNKRLRLVVPVPEAQVGEMKPGQQASFTVPAYPSQTFKAPIKRISHQIDEKTRSMPIELDVLNADGKLSPGSFTTVSWPLDRSTPSLFVPASAVASDQQRTFVIRVHNNKAEWVTVQTGQIVAGDVEVFGQLNAGDQVIKSATDAIRSGDTVQAQAANPTPNPLH
jgi:membrane fusion protein (multidrug efflux system)